MRSLLLVTLLATPPQEGWRPLYERSGFRAYERPGQPPSYRAEGILEVDLAEVAAVLTDLPRHREWVSHLAECRVLEGDPRDRCVVYSRFDLPWPVQDRDAVVQNAVTRLVLEGTIQVRFWSTPHPGAPVRSDCLRVPRTEGSFTLRELAPGRVAVTYEVRLDPGGWLPAWLVRAFVKDAPHTTLQAFLAQVRRTRGQYQDFIARERARWEQERALR